MFYLSSTQPTALQKGNIKICVCAAMRLCVATTTPSPVPVTTVPYLVQRTYYTETSCNNRLANEKKLRKPMLEDSAIIMSLGQILSMDPEPGVHLFSLDPRITNSKHMKTKFPTWKRKTGSVDS